MRQVFAVPILLLTASSAVAQPPLAAHPRRPELAPGQTPPELVTYQTRELTLKGFLYKPEGPGPFPAMIWNHGSEKEPGWQPELAAFYTRRGFVFFVPHRHGHGRSAGEYIVDINNRLIAAAASEEAAWPEMVKLHSVYNRDVAAAVTWLKSQPFVDRNRVVMSGVSYGGIQTLISAETIPGIRGFIAFAPGAMSWKMIPLRERLLEAIHNAKAPIFLVQAANDYSTGPSEVLGPVIRKKGPPNDAKLYPAFGPVDNHGMGHASFATWNVGTAIWGTDVMGFIDAVMR